MTEPDTGSCAAVSYVTGRDPLTAEMCPWCGHASILHVGVPCALCRIEVRLTELEAATGLEDPNIPHPEDLDPPLPRPTPDALLDPAAAAYRDGYADGLRDGQATAAAEDGGPDAPSSSAG